MILISGGFVGRRRGGCRLCLGGYELLVDLLVWCCSIDAWMAWHEIGVVRSDMSGVSIHFRVEMEMLERSVRARSFTQHWTL